MMSGRPCRVPRDLRSRRGLPTTCRCFVTIDESRLTRMCAGSEEVRANPNRTDGPPHDTWGD